MKQDYEIQVKSFNGSTGTETEGIHINATGEMNSIRFVDALTYAANVSALNYGTICLEGRLEIGNHNIYVSTCDATDLSMRRLIHELAAYLTTPMTEGDVHQFTIGEGNYYDVRHYDTRL